VVDLADIVRGEIGLYVQTRGLTSEQRKAVDDIMCCRTEAMGSVAQRCEKCDAEYWLYRSCRNRSCPSCGSEARQTWLQARRQEILAVPYLQIVFTTPQELNVVALHCPKVFYGALIHAAGQAVIDVGWSQRHARLGCLVHLQTWGQTMPLHPHAHCVVPCGGFSEDGSQWVSFEPHDLSAGALSKRFRLLLCKAILAAARWGRLGALPGTVSVEQLLASVATREWPVHAEPPFGGVERLLGYLSRYTHRVAITNDRIVSYQNGQVTFRWCDKNNEQRLCTLDAQEFLRRFLLHVLPKGFVRVRSYGFLGNRNRRTNLERARRLIGQAQKLEPVPEPIQPLRLCPACYAAANAHERMPRKPAFAPCPAAASGLVFTLRPPPHSVAA